MTNNKLDCCKKRIDVAIKGQIISSVALNYINASKEKDTTVDGTEVMKRRRENSLV